MCQKQVLVVEQNVGHVGPPDVGKREHGGAMSTVRSLQIVWLKVDLNDGLEVVLVVQAAVSARLLALTTTPIFGWDFKVRQTEPRKDEVLLKTIFCNILR